MTEIPSCPKCGAQLDMLRRYYYAPSVAFCTACFIVYDATYQEEPDAWVVTMTDWMSSDP